MGKLAGVSIKYRPLSDNTAGQVNVTNHGFAIASLLAFASLMQLGFGASLPMPLPNIMSGFGQIPQFSNQHYSYNGGFVPLEFATAASKSKFAPAPAKQVSSVVSYNAFTVIGTPTTNLSILLQQQAASGGSPSGSSINIFDVPQLAPGPTSSPTKTQRVIFAVYDSQMLTNITTNLKPYISQNDAFDLVSGNNGNPLNITQILNWAKELHAAYPDSQIFAHTAGLANYAALAKGVSGSAISGVLYDYEPEMSNEPEFNWNFASSISNFQQETSIAHQYRLLSIAYPTGRPILESDLQTYDWNYATIAQNTDGQIIQTQTDCFSSTSKYENATQKVAKQYSLAGASSSPIFQITLNGGGVNAVDAAQAYNCTKVLTSDGYSTVYIWWSSSDLSELESYLSMIGR